MSLEIKKLSADLLDDWLYFFDNIAFTDNDGWAGCYCMCYHWNEAMDSKKAWNCSKDDAPYNRRCAVDFIRKGKLQGYLAYEDGKAVGWCNANDKQAYDSVNFRLPADSEENGRKVKSIVCFCISPDARGKGIASRLLETVCAEAAADGYDYIESYPFHHNANHDYHGPQAMYEKAGFEPCGSGDGYNIFRKTL